jgi:hypothetical protein
LSVAEAMQRIRPLMQSASLQRDSTRRRLLREMDQLAELLGLTFDDDLFDSDRARDPRSGRGR